VQPLGRAASPRLSLASSFHPSPSLGRQHGDVETRSQAAAVDHDEAAGTPCNLSAELRYEAPLATFDGDEWTEFLLDAPPDNNHFRSPVDDVTSGGGGEFVETWSGSLEDLVNTFDARITACFRNYNEHVRRAACCWLWPRPGPPRIRYAYFRLYRR